MNAQGCTFSRTTRQGTSTLQCLPTCETKKCAFLNCDRNLQANTRPSLESKHLVSWCSIPVLRTPFSPPWQCFWIEGSLRDFVLGHCPRDLPGFHTPSVWASSILPMVSDSEGKPRYYFLQWDLREGNAFFPPSSVLPWDKGEGVCL